MQHKLNFMLHYWFKGSSTYLKIYNENKYWDFRIKQKNDR
jgi:hypothetical protein